VSIVLANSMNPRALAPTAATHVLHIFRGTLFGAILKLKLLLLPDGSPAGIEIKSVGPASMP
jgi:hypothetical protein